MIVEKKNWIDNLIEWNKLSLCKKFDFYVLILDDDCFVKKSIKMWFIVVCVLLLIFGIIIDLERMCFIKSDMFSKWYFFIWN